MPLITIHTAQRLTNAQKENLKCGLGRIITILPEKEERMLMVDIGDQHDIYFRGKKCESAAFVEVRVKGRIDLQIKSEVTEAVFELLKQQAGIENDEAYLCFLEFENWGSRGILK